MKYKNLWLFLIALLLLSAWPACSDSVAPSKPIVLVNGCAVTEKEFSDELGNMLLCWDVRQSQPAPGVETGPQTSAFILEDDLKTMILSERLIPLAALKANYRDLIPKLMAQAEEIKKELAPDGSNFAELARKYSKDSNGPGGGSLGFFTRTGLVYPVSSLAFQAKAGEIIGPFLSLVGCHLLFVESKSSGVIPASDRVQASHILLPYEEGNMAFLSERLPEIMAEVQAASGLEILDPAYSPYVKIDSAE